MLRALFIVYAVASSALLDDATAADAETRAEHIVQLCAEHHRDAVGAAYPDAYHIRHLPSLRGLVVEATQAEVAALKSHEGVCNVARSHEVTHRPDAGRRLDVDALRRNNEWWGKSHNQGKPWNLDRVNGKLDGNDAFEVSSKGTNVFVLDTGLDTLHQEFEGDREVENVGSYSNFHPGGVWEDKEEWDLTSENRAWLKDNNDSDGHGSFPVPVTPSPRIARRRRKTSPAHRHALRVDGGGQELWNSPPSQRLRHESTTRRLGGRHRARARQSLRLSQKKKSEGSDRRLHVSRREV